MAKTITEMTKEEREVAREKARIKRDAVIAEFIQENPYKLKSFFLGIPVSRRWSWLCSFMGKSSRLEAIKAKCRECSAWQDEEVTFCQVHQCPLWKYRPFQEKGK